MTTAEARERFLNEMRYGQGDEVKLNALDALIAAVRAEERAKPIRCHNHRRPDFSLSILEFDGELGAATCWLCANELRAEAAQAGRAKIVKALREEAQRRPAIDGQAPHWAAAADFVESLDRGEG